MRVEIEYNVKDKKYNVFTEIFFHKNHLNIFKSTKP